VYTFTLPILDPMRIQ